MHCGLEPAFFDGPPTLLQHAKPDLRWPALRTEGQLLLIEAARRLAEAGVDFTLTLAGDGELRAEIEALIKQLRA